MKQFHKYLNWCSGGRGSKEDAPSLESEKVALTFTLTAVSATVIMNRARVTSGISLTILRYDDLKGGIPVLDRVAELSSNIMPATTFCQTSLLLYSVDSNCKV